MSSQGKLEAEQANPDHKPRVPWVDYRQFGPLVAEESEVLEADIPETATIAFQDRSLVDTIAYSRLNNFDEFVPEVLRKVAIARYSFALICQPVGEYITATVRRETRDKALQTHLEIERSYEESGIEVISIPAISTDERVAFISEVLQSRNLV